MACLDHMSECALHCVRNSLGQFYRTRLIGKRIAACQRTLTVKLTVLQSLLYCCELAAEIEYATRGVCATRLSKNTPWKIMGEGF